jgi:hypothetical protein
MNVVSLQAAIFRCYFNIPMAKAEMKTRLYICHESYALLLLTFKRRKQTARLRVKLNHPISISFHYLPRFAP